MYTLPSPFPWFGGKSIVAPEVWARFGPVSNYVEPFCGSAAMLFGCPYEIPTRTINDADGFVANFWRSVAYAPDAVAAAADWPVNETDLMARHLALLERRDGLFERLVVDPKYYDAEAAGWWVWGVSAWIGGGWCSGRGPWHVVDGRLIHEDRGHGPNDRRLRGVTKQAPHLAGGGRGIHRSAINRSAHVVNETMRVTKRIPDVGSTGRGMHRISLGSTVSERSEALREYMRDLADVLRTVRVVSGDWARITTPTVTTRLGITGVFLDPPYGEGDMDYSVGGNGTGDIAADVWRWACDNGGDRMMRIAVCGHADNRVVPPGWTVYRWRRGRGYGKNSGKRDEETIWFSPHCLTFDNVVQGVLGEGRD